MKIVEWTEEEDRRLFELYKEKGSCWSSIATEFEGRTENQVKNRFYSTLRRLATKHSSTDGQGEQVPKTKKKDLLKFVDEAIVYGHNCRSKRGRKRKLSNKDSASENLSEKIAAGGSEKPESAPVEAVAVTETKPAAAEIAPPVSGPDYAKLLLAHNEQALKMYEEKIGQADENINRLAELLEIQKELEEKLKTTQEIIKRSETESKDAGFSLDLN